MLPFFTLPQEYRSALFTQIHEIVFFGKGGYDWEVVYNMPIWLRKFTYKTMNDFYEKQQEANDQASNKGKLVTANKPLAKPGIPDSASIKPTYTSKVSKK